MSYEWVNVIGGGLAGLSAAVALADSGLRVRLLEQRPFLGGRATSYALPDGSTVDNCQHVTLGCCTNLANFYRRVGAEEKIHYYNRLYFADAKGRRYGIQSSFLPPPFHMAFSFLRFNALTLADKKAIGSAMLEIATTGGKPRYVQGSTMLTWLHRMGQTPGAIDRFWRVVLVSALDEELARTDAKYGVEVFWKAFLANREGYRVGIPSVPLGELYDGCKRAIEARGGEVRTRAVVRRLRIEGGHVVEAGEAEVGAAVGVSAGGATEAWDAAVGATETSTGRAASSGGGRDVGGAEEAWVLAVPHDAAGEIVGEDLVSRDQAFRGLQHLQDSPITGVHLWFDRRVMSEPFLTLLDHTVQWIFNKTELNSPNARRAPGNDRGKGASGSQGGLQEVAGGQYLQLVISASYDLVARARPEIVEMCLKELGEVLPAVRRANLVKSTVIKEVAATFSPAPGVDQWRPGARCGVSNLYLAGDWVQTGWPATMEGAVRSGYLAAEAVLADAGRPAKLVQQDLPVEGFSKRWARKSTASA
jgi:uncharacterized protein with NAD-binding domain and iron-sulfur cluster